MPKHPLEIKVNQLMELSNIYAEELFSQKYDDASALVSDNERNYLFSYHEDCFNDMIIKETRMGQEIDYLVR